MQRGSTHEKKKHVHKTCALGMCNYFLSVCGRTCTLVNVNGATCATYMHKFYAHVFCFVCGAPIMVLHTQRKKMCIKHVHLACVSIFCPPGGELPHLHVNHVVCWRLMWTIVLAWEVLYIYAEYGLYNSYSTIYIITWSYLTLCPGRILILPGWRLPPLGDRQLEHQNSTLKILQKIYL